MKAIFNSRITDASHPLLKVTNRAFCYGDGLFETIVTGPNRINLSQRHLLRLQQGATALGIDFPTALTLKNLEKWSDLLITENTVVGDYRIRLHLWRNSGGLYAPEKESSSFLLELTKSESPLILDNLKAGLDEDYMNVYSPISRFKSKSALKYVMLGKSKTQRGLDDVIMLDAHGNLSESHTSNLFWIKNNQIYTPSLKTGCVSGVMRAFLLDYLKELNIPVVETLTSKDQLDTCDSIFTTNASGVRWFSLYEGRKLESPEPLLAPLIRRLQQP